MSTANFHTKNACGIYYMDDDSAELFEEICWDSYFGFHGIEIMADLEVTLNHGYYEGHNLDWEIRFEGFRYSDYEDMDDFLEDFRDEYLSYVNLNEGMAEIQWPNFCKRFKSWIQKCIIECEKKCREMCDEVYHCIGVFSNGEAIYERVGR